MIVDKRSITNNLIASFLWAILVAIAAYFLPKIFDIKILNTSIPLWAFAFVSTLLLLLSIYSIVNLLRRKKLVFIVMPAFSHKHWFAQLLQNLLIELHTRGYDAVVKIPSHEFSPQGQAEQLRSIGKRRGEFAAGFVVAVESDNMRDELVQFCKHLNSPVIFMDVRPFNNRIDYPINTAFVGYPATEIGRRAALFVTSYLRQRSIEQPYVLVIGSLSQADRQKEFEKILKEKLPKVELTINEGGAFQRERAKEIVLLSLEQARRQKRQIDCIFCTNDEMALGALDAVLASTGSVARKACIIGVDGTEEAISVIRSGGTPFQATIIQDSHRVAEIAVELFLKKQNGERVEQESFLTPEVYPRNVYSN